MARGRGIECAVPLWTGTASKAQARAVREISSTAKRGRQAAEGTDDRREYLAAMETAELRRSVLFETLVLLASSAAIEAAHEVNLVLWQEENTARDGGATPVEGGRGLIELINRHHEQARADLGVPHSA
jgi:hypothetical protein